MTNSKRGKLIYDLTVGLITDPVRYCRFYDFTTSRRTTQVHLISLPVKDEVELPRWSFSLADVPMLSLLSIFLALHGIDCRVLHDNLGTAGSLKYCLSQHMSLILVEMKLKFCGAQVSAAESPTLLFGQFTLAVVSFWTASVICCLNISISELLSGHRLRFLQSFISALQSTGLLSQGLRRVLTLVGVYRPVPCAAVQQSRLIRGIIIMPMRCY